MTVVSDFTSLLSGSYANDGMALGTGAYITYTFLQGSDVPAAGSGSYSNSGYSGFTLAQQASLKSALAHAESITGVKFVEVFDADDAAMQVVNVQGSNYGGWASYPYGGNGIFVIDGDSNYAPGTSDYETVLHELGHALGLKHPFDDDVVLRDDLDNDNNTLMSYTGNGLYDTAFAPFDAQALNYIYGSSVSLAGISHFWAESNSTLYITGSNGNDAMTGAITNNYIDGGYGDDTIAGQWGDDTLLGGEGNDTIMMSWGDDIIDGGNGFDTISFANSDYGRFLDMNYSGTNVTSIEQFIGSNFDDSFYGSYSIATNDIIVGGLGADYMSGGAGFDIASYSTASYGLTATFGIWTNGGDAAGDRFDSVEGLIGSAFGDYLAGDNSGNYIDGYSGDDVIYGYGGHDTVSGGYGNDIIHGGDGFDTIDGGAGYDNIYGGPGANMVSYTSAWSGIQVELFQGTASNDGHGAADGLANIQWIGGSFYNDAIYADAADNVISGYGGADSIFGGWGNDYISGGTGLDYLSGSNGYDTFVFAAGDFDTAGFDTIADFSENSTDYDFLRFEGISVGDVQAYDYQGSVYVYTTSGFDRGIVLQNFTAAQLADQMVFA